MRSSSRSFLAVVLPFALAACGAQPATNQAGLARPIVMTSLSLSGELQPTPVVTVAPEVPPTVAPPPSPTVFPSSSAKPYAAPPSPQTETADEALNRLHQIESQISAADAKMRAPQQPH